MEISTEIESLFLRHGQTRQEERTWPLFSEGIVRGVRDFYKKDFDRSGHSRQ